MNTRKTLITLLVLCIIMPSAVIYSLGLQNSRLDKELTDIEHIALEFLLNCPTFRFDGVMESIEIIETYSMESYPVQYVVVISFDTTHVGWGDRAGTFAAQVLTPHIIRIKIVENNVVRATIDEKWDEIAQAQIIPDELLLPEMVRDQAVQFLMDNYQSLGLVYPEKWMSEMFTSSELVGVSNLRFLGGGWNILVRYPVVQYPDFDVEISYNGTYSFVWSGKVYNTGEISEEVMIIS